VGITPHREVGESGIYCSGRPFLMFLGEYLHTFDAKNRISVPTKFRKGLGRVVVVTRGLDHCLYVFSHARWVKEATTYAAEVSGNASRRGLARLFLAGSFEVEIDKSGRMLVPEHLKSYAALKDTVIVAGVADRVELWEEGAWKAYTAMIERDADAFAEKVDAS